MLGQASPYVADEFPHASTHGADGSDANHASGAASLSNQQVLESLRRYVEEKVTWDAKVN